MPMVNRASFFAEQPSSLAEAAARAWCRTKPSCCPGHVQRTGGTVGQAMKGVPLAAAASAVPRGRCRFECRHKGHYGKRQHSRESRLLVTMLAPLPPEVCNP